MKKKEEDVFAIPKIIPLIFLAVMFLYLRHDIKSIKTVSQEDFIEARKIENEIELIESWDYHSESRLVTAYGHDGKIYFVTSNNQVLVFSEEGELEKTIKYENELSLYIYNIEVDNNYINLRGEQVVIVIDAETEKIVSKIKLPHNQSNACLSGDILFYTDEKHNVVGKNIYSKEIVWEFKDNPQNIKYSVFSFNGRIFFSATFSLDLHEIKADSYEEIKYVVYKERRAKNDKNVDGYQHYKIKGISDRDVEERYNRTKQYAFRPVDDGNYFYLTSGNVVIFNSEFEKIKETELLLLAYHGELYKDKLVLRTKDTREGENGPITMFDMTKKKTVWVDNRDAEYRDFYVYNDKLYIWYKDGYLRVIEGSE